ncbi:MAG: hypothetical protein LBP68_08095, partial [Acidobacteriota bacterium]|nr:hypothetical protein [Acidobacteriota bacterium]
MKDIGTIKRRLGGIGSVLGGFRPGTASRLLVFESTGFALYGMVARRDITAETAQVAVSWAPEPEAAVGEVLARLREMEGKRLPGKAVLVTPSAVGRLVNLPVDPRNPQPPAQMRELVRWEVEELFVRHNDLWSLGALLVGRGYLAPAERLELESASGERRTDPDLYVELVGGRARIDECLAMQEQLLYADDELVLGWSPQAKEDEGGPWTWYGAGIGDSVRTRWVRAFQKNKVFCATIHPELGAAIPLIPLIP